VRRAAARSQCANNLKQITLGLHNYADNYSGTDAAGKEVQLLPAGTVSNAALPPDQRLSWFVEILPFVEQVPLYESIDRKARWDSAGNAPAVQTPVRMFQCPDWTRESAAESAYTTPYLGVAGLGAEAPSLPATDRYAGIFGYDRRTSLAAIPDGTSNTLLILESARDNGPWVRGGPSTVRGLDPAEQPYLGTGRPFGGTHFAENSVIGRGASVGCNAALADGTVRFLSESVAPHVLEALATKAGGEAVGSDW
jgi:hypothetical protein